VVRHPTEGLADADHVAELEQRVTDMQGQIGRDGRAAGFCGAAACAEARALIARSLDGIIDRLSTLIRSNINDLISRAENPQKVSRQLIIDMRNQLAKAKAAGGRRHRR